MAQNLSDLYDANFKKIRGKAAQGWIRPTIGEYFMTHKDFVEIDVIKDTRFITTWFIEEGDKTITLPLWTWSNYNMTVDWGDGTTSEIDDDNHPEKTHTYTTAGTKTIAISGTCGAWRFWNEGDKLKFRTVENWGDVGFTYMQGAFWGCSNATSFGDKIPYYPITSLNNAWSGCSSATSFPDISALTDVIEISAAWYNCSSAESFPDVSDLADITSLYQTWCGCSSARSLPDVSNLAKVNNVAQTWYNCSSAESFPDVSTLIDVENMFYTWCNCSSAEYFPDVSALTKVTNMTRTWLGCSSCKVVPTLPTASTALTECSRTFQSNSSMAGTVVELWDSNNFPNITIHDNCFLYATSLDNYDNIPSDWK